MRRDEGERETERDRDREKEEILHTINSMCIILLFIYHGTIDMTLTNTASRIAM